MRQEDLARVATSGDDSTAKKKATGSTRVYVQPTNATQEWTKVIGVYTRKTRERFVVHFTELSFMCAIISIQ